MTCRARATAGFTLVEVAIVVAIVALLLGSLTYTLSAQVEQAGIEETRRRHEQAKSLLLAFAIVHGRLPCPARSTSFADEVRNASGQCTDGSTEDYYGGTLAGGVTGGLLPARAIGFQPVDAEGFALDAWGNRIRYAVEKFVIGCSGPSVLPHFTSGMNLKANGITCQPRDLLVCKSSAGVSGVVGATNCGAAANALTNQNVVAALVYSPGKNAAGAASGDEAANANGDAVFVSHAPTPPGAANGEFDDLVTWIAVGELYARLIAAGVFP
ncbi:MAG TPA: prepilin-type N-terminal cleavage/methylation domain-containing protein [Burkholderiales bacterium]|nr:prepilin-type N-terminal cleavage/methylation domain-containing protein [Burkholderiales bacterium]